MSDEAKRIKFTARVRRGLALVALIARQSFDDNTLSSHHQAGKWTKAQRDEYDLALAWIEQETRGA